ncbi:MAG: bifunctional metallophosphatase/5'-nucleotidase [Firmicutes bacterium]|jgi:2',3'-cyclic-nucleotide 2'-phosphodiesterase (5'-nucleotidase family)|nr:bifunctional metallophosphatase/5'-nucleotidase [Bacillota bacterium]
MGKNLIVAVVALLLSSLMIFPVTGTVLAVTLTDEGGSADGDKNPEGTEKYLTILHTGDIHARIQGFPRMAGVANEIRARKEALGEPVLLTDGGDFVSPIMNTWLNFMGFAPELTIMQEIGYDVVTFGNHEFDPGHLGLAKLLKNAGYPEKNAVTTLLGTNIVPPDNHPLNEPGLFERTYLKKLDNGLSVGFFGIIGRDTLPPYIFKNGPVTFSDPHEAAREAINILQKEGADIIIALSHANTGSNRDLARDVSGIDIILAAHEHRAEEKPLMENGTIIMQTSSFLEHLCMIELAYDPDSGKLRLRNEESGLPYQIPLDDSAEEDTTIAALVVDFEDKLDRGVRQLTGGKYRGADDVVAHAQFPLKSMKMQEMPLGNFAADAYRIIAGQKIGEKVDFALVPSGMCWGELGPGAITFRDIADIPLMGTGQDLKPGHPLVSFFLTGEEVRRILEIFFFLPELRGKDEYPQISGLRLDYDPRRVVLLDLPFKVVDFLGDRTPVPTFRAVTGADRFTGNGRQSMDDVDYLPIEWGDEKLYRVVTESYILYHLPTVDKVVHLLPKARIVPRDEDGNPLSYMTPDGDISKEAIIHDDQGNELKAWQALVEYAAIQPIGEDGIPGISSYYEDTAERINTVWTIPLLLWPLLAIVLLVTAILLIRRHRRKKKTATA